MKNDWEKIFAFEWFFGFVSPIVTPVRRLAVIMHGIWIGGAVAVSSQP
jgi:hypothetical protein